MDLTVDELIGVINHSASPMLIVEGSDDVIVYRRLEEVFLESGLTVQPAGGRSMVLQVFERRGEIVSNPGVLFLVDRDFWVITPIPPHYIDPYLVMTDGYSIENDVYTAGNLEAFLTPQERIAFQLELQRFARWYALAVEKHIGGAAQALSTHPHVVLDSAAFKASIEAELQSPHYPEARYDQIIAEYGRMIRGKSLLGLLGRQLLRAGRRPQHHPLSLLEAASVVGTTYMSNLSNLVKVKLQL